MNSKKSETRGQDGLPRTCSDIKTNKVRRITQDEMFISTRKTSYGHIDKASNN